MARIKFLNENLEIEAECGITVLEAEIKAGLKPDAPCGGMGKCGKCLIKTEGKVQKACQIKIEKDMEIEILQKNSNHQILAEGFSREIKFEPSLRMAKVSLEKPQPGDNRSDWQRLKESLLETDKTLDAEKIKPDLKLAGSLYEKRKQRKEWYVIYTDEKILELRTEPGRRYLAAFDIGTTTVAGYLMDGANGKTLAVASRMNPQTQYGADVILRANYALEHGIGELSRCIRETVDEMLGVLAAQAEVSRQEIFQVSMVGNTCMHHLFLGIMPDALVHAPYTPAYSERLVLQAADYGIEAHPQAELIFLPDIAGYVGADTCGCLLTLRQDLKEEISLMLDIGTNGEMVMGNRMRLAACSTAAGPAFEGARIECGMRGSEGAVDHVRYENGTWKYTTIGKKPAIGLCGSGLIDLTAELCRIGYIDENGRMDSRQENPQTFMLVSPEDSGNEKGVYLTQKDIGEIQLAKAAIAAGIQLLMKELGISEKDIQTVYIAGAFGNYMDPVSAGKIGIFPASLTPKVRAVGNAAGEGAKIVLLNKNELEQMDELVKKISFVELAASPDFQDCFIDELCF